MKENKKTIKKNKFDIGKELKKFLMCSKNCISLEEAIKKIKGKSDFKRKTKTKN